MDDAQITETRGPFPFFAAVQGAEENTAAHGGVCYVDVCDDGKTRRRNANGSHTETGPWV